MAEPLILKDGETLVVIVEAPMSVSDPTDESKYLSQAYRVVADRVSPTLALVPLSASPVRVPSYQVTEHIARRSLREGVPIILKFLNNPAFLAAAQEAGYDVSFTALLDFVSKIA